MAYVTRLHEWRFMWNSEENLKVKTPRVGYIHWGASLRNPVGKKSSNVRSNIFYVKVVFDYYKQRKLFESGDICLFCPILFLKNGFSSWSFLLLQRHGLSLLSTNLLVVVPRWTWFFHSLFICLNECFSPLFSVVRTLICG
jgi:hypothetical protein